VVLFNPSSEGLVFVSKEIMGRESMAKAPFLRKFRRWCIFIGSFDLDKYKDCPLRKVFGYGNNAGKKLRNPYFFAAFV
jgi:hypothetical protein